MDYYKQVIRDTLEEKIAEGDETKEEILKRWEEGDTQDDFGNMTGSRFCNAYKAQEALKEAGFPWDDDLCDLLEEVGYTVGDVVKRGAEVADVILCELTVPYMVEELR